MSLHESSTSLQRRERGFSAKGSCTVRIIAQAGCCIALASLFSVGCYGSAGVYPATYSSTPVYTEESYAYDAPPADIEAQSYVVYEGAPTYYVNGRWYRHTHRGWGYYRSEPAPLVRRRPYVQGAPPADRGPRRGGSQEAPPAYRR